MNSSDDQTAIGAPVARGGGRIELPLWLAALAVSRIVLLLVLVHLTNGREFTDDVPLHLSMMQEPMQILLGTHPENAHFPPLLPLVESAIGQPMLAVFGPFVALRLAYIVTELAAFASTWALLGMTCAPAARRLLAATWIIAPATWMTSTVMAQEEMISMLCFALMSLLLLRRRVLSAILVCSVGVLVAKIFFLVPLLALVVSPPPRSFRGLALRALLAGAPIAAVYVPATIIWHRAGLGLPLATFSPPVELSTTFWAVAPRWTSLSLDAIKHVSMVLALVGGLAPLAILWWRGDKAQGKTLIQLCTAMLLWVYALFYCISPEYYVLFLPGLLVVLPLGWAIAFLLGMMSLAWGINFFYGVANALDAGESTGKATFVGIYQSVFPWEPGTLHDLALAGFVIMSFWLAWRVTRRLVNRAAPEPAR
jgi:hypothetical protein